MANLAHIQQEAERIMAEQQGVAEAPASAAPLETEASAEPAGPAGATLVEADGPMGASLVEEPATEDSKGVDKSSMGGQIGALVGSIGGSIAGAVVGAIGGPFGAMAGAWVGGVLGGTAGHAIGDAISDAFDDDDATVWYSMSDDEKSAVIETALIEVLIGWIPGLAGTALSRGGRHSVASTYSQIKDKIARAIGNFFGGSTGKAVAAKALDADASLKAANWVARQAVGSRKQIQEAMMEFWEEAAKEAAEAATKASGVKAVPKPAPGHWGSPEAVDEFFHYFVSTPVGMKAMQGFLRSEWGRKIQAGAGIAGLLKGAAVATQDTLPGDDTYANKGGFILPKMDVPMPTMGLLAGSSRPKGILK